MAEQETPDLIVHRFEVVALSEEFLALLKDFPEMSTCKIVEVGGKRIEGAKQVLVASSLEEITQNLPAVVAQLADPQHQHLRIIHRSGTCRTCAESKILCTHLGRTIPSLNEAWNVDVSKIPKA